MHACMHGENHRSDYPAERTTNQSLEDRSPQGMPLPAQQQPACAACKHQRRRCTPDCPLAGYFPHDHPGLFRAAHRLFGVSNILKTLRRAGPDQARRDDAMRAVIFEAGAWDANPAHGCLPFINELERQLHHEESVLSCLHAQLRHYRHRPDSTSPLPMPPPHTADAPPAPAESSNTHHFDDEYNHVPAASSGLHGNGNGDAQLQLPWTTQLDYYDGAIADMGGAVSQLPDQYQMLFDRTATAGADENEYDEISPLADGDGDDHHDGTPPYESKSASSREKMEIKPSTTMDLK